MNITPFFDTRTFTVTYVVHDPTTRDALIIDPVLDYDPAGSKIWTESSDEVVEFVREHDLNVQAILETHAHADHLSGAQHIKERLGEVPVGVGARITEVQKIFKAVFGLPAGFAVDGSQFDLLLEPETTVDFGSLSVEVIPTPGHTPACSAYLIGDAVFTGDALFMPDVGTGRCDFPGGSSEDLYDSIHERLYALPPETRVFVGHDYPGGRGREASWETTVAEQRESNVALPWGRDRADFVSWREARDATLSSPKLLFQSVQVNIDAGNLPDPDANQVSYLRIPLNVFRPEPEGVEGLEITPVDEASKGAVR
jgi:glyoxylase-like metal-dependent hydrolase (beta-lactamase superfamily II)